MLNSWWLPTAISACCMGVYDICKKDAVKDNIYEFVKNATNVAIFVDCENVNPYYFAATLRNLEEQRISKIKKIVFVRLFQFLFVLVLS